MCKNICHTQELDFALLIYQAILHTYVLVFIVKIVYAKYNKGIIVKNMQFYKTVSYEQINDTQ